MCLIGVQTSLVTGFIKITDRIFYVSLKCTMNSASPRNILIIKVSGSKLFRYDDIYSSMD